MRGTAESGFAAQVVHVALTRGGDHADEVLLLRRRNTGRGDGTWDCPAGRAEPGEAITAAAVRELDEEVGLTTSEADLVVIHECQVGTDDGPVRHVFFHARRWSGTALNLEPDRADQMRWFPTTDFPSPMLPFVEDALAGLTAG